MCRFWPETRKSHCPFSGALIPAMKLGGCHAEMLETGKGPPGAPRCLGGRAVLEGGLMRIRHRVNEQ